MSGQKVHFCLQVRIITVAFEMANQTMAFIVPKGTAHKCGSTNRVGGNLRNEEINSWIRTEATTYLLVFRADSRRRWMQRSSYCIAFVRPSTTRRISFAPTSIYFWRFLDPRRRTATYMIKFLLSLSRTFLFLELEINFWSFEIEMIHNLDSTRLDSALVCVGIWQACLFILNQKLNSS